MSGEAQGSYTASALGAALEDDENEYGIVKQGQLVSRPQVRHGATELRPCNGG